MSQQLKSRVMSSITFGKHVLDSLSIGMYSDPLMTLREYVQNAADSIDLLPHNSPHPVVEITVDGRNKSIEISDNGVGIPSREVRSMLLNIGASKKDSVNARGFRGIGRLGGLGYCDTLVFSTKSKGERTFTTCTWDSRLLRQLIHDKQSIDTYFLIDKATSVKRAAYSASEKDHFFKVQMLKIHDSRNDLLNVPAIRSYLSQVAPVPFHPDFTFGQQIDGQLLKHVPSYKSYDIILNKEKIYKQYRDTVDLSRGSIDVITDIQFVELHDESDVLAFGWLGKLRLLGTVNPASGVDGVRLRCGNILLGNKETLSALFKETRFNHYLVGEVHITDNRIAPNSRRDDLEDSDIKAKLLNEFLKEIGIPFSSKIRELSRERGKANQHHDIESLFEQALTVINYGYLSSHQRERIMARLNNVNGSHSTQEIELAKQLSEQVSATEDALSVQKMTVRSKAQILDVLNRTLEMVCSEVPASTAANKLISKLYQAISDR